MRSTLAVLVALVLVAASVAAQGRHGSRADSSRGMGMMQGQSGMMDGGMMQMMHGQSGMRMGMVMGPGMILRLQGSLALTASQVEQLEALRDSARSTMRRHMMQGMRVMHAASGMLNSDSPDLGAYENQLREATNHMVLAHTVMARAAVEARQVLSPEQRQQLSLARQTMHETQPGTMGGGMMNRGMMDRGSMDRGMMDPSGGGSTGG